MLVFSASERARCCFASIAPGETGKRTKTPITTMAAVRMAIIHHALSLSRSAMRYKRPDSDSFHPLVLLAPKANPVHPKMLPTTTAARPKRLVKLLADKPPLLISSATTEYPQPRIEQAERPQTVQHVLNPIKHLICIYCSCIVPAW